MIFSDFVTKNYLIRIFLYTFRNNYGKVHILKLKKYYKYLNIIKILK